MNNTLTAQFATLFETIEDILKNPDLGSTNLQEIPTNENPAAIVNKKQLVLFFRLAILFGNLWKLSRMSGHGKKAEDGKIHGWRKPSALMPKEKAPKGDGQKPWSVAAKARMALLRAMKDDEKSLDQVVSRLYGVGKTFEWFVANYEDLKGSKK